jgi:hypothetical protein
MRNFISAVALSTVVIASALAILPSVGYAQAVTVVGPVTKIQLAPDGKSATAMLKDGKSGEPVSILVTDDLTLDKFKDKRIVIGDEIRSRFDKQDGKNLSKSFKKTAGC